MNQKTEIPGQAKIVIIGGGIIGCSTAYHLAKMGCNDVVLLEKHKLTSGSTFHAAGLVGQLRTNANVTQLLGYSVELYKILEQETGLATGWKMNGGLRLACNEQRWIEVKRQATTAHSFGLEMHLLNPREAQDLWPLMDISDLVGAAFLPTDGQVNPSDITQSLASGARRGGVKICEDTEVTGFEFDGDDIRAVHTSQGSIGCERLVICGGQWSHQLGRMAGVNIPLVSVQHQYLVTEAMAGVAVDLPTLRDPDRLTYFKEDVGGLVMGGYEPNPIPWAQDGIPEGFNFTLLDNDWDHFEPLMEQAIARVPTLAEAGIRQMLNGPESFTPDGNFILGQAPERNNVFVGTGFNAFGIASGGGAGMALAEWTLNGEPPFDLWPVDIRRFGEPHRDIEWVRQRTLEAYSKHYTMAWPFEENRSCRPSRRSPLYPELKSRGACFGEKLGWERPNWFAENTDAAYDEYSFERQNWFQAVGLEHRAVRESAAVFDQSSFAKYRVSGKDAETALSWIRGRKRHGRLHANAERARRHRERFNRYPDQRKRVLPGDRHRLRYPRPRLDTAQPAERARCSRRRRNLRMGRVVADGTARARGAAGAGKRGSPQSKFCLCNDAGTGNFGRYRQGPARQLRRRARLGIACAGGIRAQRLPGPDACRKRTRHRRRRLPRDRIAQAGEGLPCLERRYRTGLHPAGGGTRLGARS
jgi:4-methylaminobutanoate oxidase (formaldehyde-forming)